MVRFIRSKSAYRYFLAKINRAGTFNDCYSFGRQYDATPAARVTALLAQRCEKEPDTDALERYAKVTGESELSQSEKGLSILATVGSTSPFIGLFGTVWGIMEAFIGIGKYGSPNLAVVAPGIAEALVCTAAGLVVAVPAVIGYNHFVGRVREEARRIETAAEIVLSLHRRFASGVR
ncbi:MAG: MotA/TolQ/ExbB proton channel family protein [bacterium]|nr:MotA/TolQ/ExbB proton channel family protein [bacterium]